MKSFKPCFALSLLVLALAMLTLTSCTKDNTTPKPIALNGRWEGSFHVPNDNTPYYLAFNFDPAGTLTVFDDQANPNTATGTGTWNLNGTVLSGEFYNTLIPNTIYSFTATFDNKTGDITAGTWGFKPNVTGQATWSMTKP